MGAYATLTFGNFAIDDWRYKIPLEALLLFTQDDLVKGVEKNDEGEEYPTYKFVVSALLGKERVNSRGFDLEYCRSLFDDIKSDPSYNFDRYLYVLESALESGQCAVSYFLSDDKETTKALFGGFFDKRMIEYLPEAHTCLLIRSLLEVSPNDSQITFDISELVETGFIDNYVLENFYDIYYDNIMLSRVEFDYKLFSFVLQDNPRITQKLRNKIGSFSEDHFINYVMLPLLERMGFNRIRKVTHHGRNEFGSDILPFRGETKLGILEYYALQAKAVDIHGTSSKDGNAGELISQAIQAFSVTFVDYDLDNERKNIDKYIIATNKSITPDARRVVEDAIAGNRKIIFLDIDKIVELVKTNHLVRYLLYSNFSQEF